MGTDHYLDFCFSQPPGALIQSLFHIEDVHPLKVESQANETPLTGRSGQAAQGELSKAEDLFDNADDRFDRTFAQAIDRLPDLRLELVGHLDGCTGCFSRWFRLFSKEGMPILMMRFASGGNVRVHLVLLDRLDIGGTEIAMIQSYGLRLADLGREGFQGRNGFLLVIGMIRKAVSHDQQTGLFGGHLYVVVLVKALIGSS
jgi:hypothetical protein